MPAFFVPMVEPDGQDKAYQAIVEGAENPRDMGRPVLPRRIFRLRYLHDGRELTAEVGELDPFDGQPVMAILDQGDCYTIRTLVRGYLEIGEPIIVGKPDVLEVLEFD